MSKFQYASGRPGFGSRGEDGSAGLHGLSLYFSDYDTVTESASIQTAIINNTILCSSTLYTLTSSPLPGGRTYNIGDIFIDINGGVYEILNPSTGAYTYKFARLNTTGLFTSAEVETDTHRFKRYFNNNLEPKYIIDNVYASEEVNYYSVPSAIYNISPQNYARIEFSNINDGPYNPFTLYSAGENENTAIAIVRDICTNTFRIGNLDNNGNVRNVKLMFDVSSLMINKEDAVTHFSTSTPTGTVITNYEINANSLFKGNFNSNPESFNGFAGHNYATISWDKLDFSNDTELIADLYVYKDVSTQGTINISNASDYRPIVYSNCNNSGNLTITGLTESTTYKYYMNLVKNGWIRRSSVKSFTTSAAPYLYIWPNAATQTLWADASGVWDGSTRSDTTHYMVDICTNSITGWYISGIYDPEVNPCPPEGGDIDWITIEPYEGSAGTSYFMISVDRNTLSSNRAGTFYINSEAPQTYMIINQRGTAGYTPPDDPSVLGSLSISFADSGVLDISMGPYAIDVSILLRTYVLSTNPTYGTSATAYISNTLPSYSNSLNSYIQDGNSTPVPAVQPANKYCSIVNVSTNSVLTVSADLGYYEAGLYDVDAYVYIEITRAKYHGTTTDVSIINRRWTAYYNYPGTLVETAY